MGERGATGRDDLRLAEPAESDRRIFPRRLNLRDANDCDECNELDRQKTRFASISIYALRAPLSPLPLLLVFLLCAPRRASRFYIYRVSDDGM